MIQLPYRALAQRINVHGPSLNEVFDAPRDLRWTSGGVGAIVCRFTLLSHQRCATVGSLVDVVATVRVRRASVRVGARHLGSVLAALFDEHVVADARVKTRGLVGILQ